MKKTLVLLLILAVAGGLFAQETGLAWTGGIETGLHMDVYGYEDAPDPSVYMFNDDGVKGVRAWVTPTYTGDTWGAKITLKTELQGGGWNWASLFGSEGAPSMPVGSPENANRFFVSNAYGWMNFLDGMLNVKAGLIDDGVWTTKGDQDWGIATGKGIRFEVTPSAVEGLNVGVFLNYGADSNYAALPSDMRLVDFFLETALGASYEAEAFRVSVGLKLDSKADGLGVYEGKDGPNQDLGGAFGYYNEDDPSYDDAGKGMTGLLGFGFTGVENLTIKVEAAAWNLNGFGDYGTARFNETFEYQVMEALKAGILLTEQIWGNTDYDNSAFYFRFKPYAEYKISDPMTAGIAIPVVINGGFKYLEVNPWFQYAMGTNASIKIGYAAKFFAENAAADVTYYYPDAGDSHLDHAIQATFKYSF